MIYREIKMSTAMEDYRQYYKSINGGIDGYYEKTILNAIIYEIADENVLGYFSVHKERGLTSLVVLPKYRNQYTTIFNYVLQLPLFEKILFTDKDQSFLQNIVKQGYTYEVQAYNFEIDEEITTDFTMTLTVEENHKGLKTTFGEFIAYNQIDLENCESFFYMENNEYVSFGALEPLRLNNDRFCLSMIVNEKHRKKDYGTKTVQFLIQHLQSKNLQVNARCYVENVVSKRTLLKSGLHISNHLCKIEQL